MTPRILITGAPGTVGTEIVQLLRHTPLFYRIGAHHPERAQEAFPDAPEITPFDFRAPATYAGAFDGIDTMWLVRPPALSNVQRDIAPALAAAVQADVKHIVFLSIQGVEHNRVVPHYKIEQLLLKSGVAYTFLRASFFMQNLATTHRAEIRDHDEIAVPVGNAKTSFIDARDIAAVAVESFTHAHHKHRAYTLTGSEALTYDQVAVALSAALERRIRYTRPSLLRFIRRQVARGHALTYTLVLAALYTITRLGNAATVTPQVEEILGRPPIRFAQFVDDYRQEWQRPVLATPGREAGGTREAGG
jgi:uncharacterized protein YbjT (DUF2867 family)